MSVNLNEVLSIKNITTDGRALLDNLQPNILRPHTREILTMLFLRIDDPVEGKRVIKALSAGPKPLVKSTSVHLTEIAAFHATGKPGTAYVGVGLSRTGYDALGVANAQQPPDPAFQAGMAARGGQLADPLPAKWQTGLRNRLDAVVLIGDQMQGSQEQALQAVRAILAANPKVVIVFEQEGRGLHNRNDDGIEHFGYVDGRSQPIFLDEEVTAEREKTDGATNWDPALPIGRAVVSDPASPDPAKCFGSYFVFRKLEQNVRKFKQQEAAFAKRLGLEGDDAERAGALLVGRFEDGTPVAVQADAGSHSPVLNDFTYASDLDGGKCPHFAHIRKVNPRGSGGFEPVAGERLHIMARRGQTYGARTDDPNDGKFHNKPVKDVGLLFMAFNADLQQQFEFAQGTWANNPGFPQAPTAPGLDPVIGQGPRPDLTCPVEWGIGADKKQRKTKKSPVQTVTLLGGEYFFMPSLAYLKAP